MPAHCIERNWGRLGIIERGGRIFFYERNTENTLDMPLFTSEDAAKIASILKRTEEQ
jgi:hypothetical protein